MSIKNTQYPCETCPVLPICLTQDHYTILMKCDILTDHLIHKYIYALEHFGRVNIQVDSLNKMFEIKFDNEGKNIVIGQPFGFDIPFSIRRVLINPYDLKKKQTV